MSTKDPEPMDPSAREGDSPQAYTPNPRNTYGMDALIAEMDFLFPGIGYETSNRNPRGVAFDVQFDIGSVLPEDRDQFRLLLELLGDPRINEVISDAEGVLVSFVNNPVIQDDRSPFGLAEAWEILSGGEA